MRRKSERSKKAKGSPEKSEKLKKGRLTRRSKQSSSSEAESGEEATPQVVEAVAEPESNSHGPETHTINTDDKVWQVKSDDSSSGTGKLKICLSTRLPLTPEPESTPRSRKKLNRTMSETPSESAEEKKRSRHKSRRATRESKDSLAVEIHSEDENSTGKAKMQEEYTSESEHVIQSETNTVSTSSEVKESNQASSNVDENISGSDKIEVKSKITEIDSATVSEEKNERKCKVAPLTPITKRRRSRRLSGSSPERNSSPEPSESVKLPQISEEPEQNQTENVQTSTFCEDSSEDLQGTKNKDDVCNSNAKITDNVETDVQEVKRDSAEKKLSKSSDEDGQTSESPENQTEIFAKQLGKSESNPQTDSNTSISKCDDRSQFSVKDEQKSSTDRVVNDKNHNTSSKRRSSVTNNDANTDQYKSEDFLKTNRSSRSNYAQENDIHRNDVSDNVPNHSNKENDPLEEVLKPLEPEEKKLLEPEETYNDTPIVVTRKRRWGSLASRTSLQRPVSISTDILKDIIPDVKPAELEEAIKDRKQQRKSESNDKHKEKVERPVLPKIVIDNSENVNLHRREKDKEYKEKRIDAPLTEHRKISIVKEENYVAQPPSPAKNKTSSVLYITNLVRPFTLPQLKNLLQRTGKIVPEGFWIDRIKSRCFVTYENEEQAIETRHALHGVTWPVSNPKTLQVDFSSKEHMDRIRAAEEQTKEVSAIPGTVEDWLREQDAKKERSAEMQEDLKPWDKRNLVREWDVGKGEKEKEKHKREERPIDKRRHRSSEKSPEPVRKFKKKEEEPPAKMLDDLFRKTKVVPCIYWLPLSAETIAVKEEQRRQHMAEHERRMKELEHSRAHRRH